MPHGTVGFSECAGHLAEIRKRHAVRLAAGLAGWF
jgi:hypothetical protein